MWALLGTDNKTVVGMISPEISIEEIENKRNGAVLIKMTPKNSPATTGGEYRQGKFYGPKGNE